MPQKKHSFLTDFVENCAILWVFFILPCGFHLLYTQRVVSNKISVLSTILISQRTAAKTSSAAVSCVLFCYQYHLCKFIPEHPAILLIRHFIDLIDILFITHMEGSYCPDATIGAAMCHGMKGLVTLYSDSLCFSKASWHIQ